MNTIRTRRGRIGWPTHAVSEPKPRQPVCDGKLHLSDKEGIRVAATDLGYPVTYTIFLDEVSESGAADDWHKLSSRIESLLNKFGKGLIQLKGGEDMTLLAEEECCTTVQQIMEEVLSDEFPVVLHSGFSALHTRFWVYRESDLECQAVAALKASPTGEVTIKACRGQP